MLKISKRRNMKKVIFACTLLIALVSCGGAAEQESATNNDSITNFSHGDASSDSIPGGAGAGSVRSDTTPAGTDKGGTPGTTGAGAGYGSGTETGSTGSGTGISGAAGHGTEAASGSKTTTSGSTGKSKKP